MTAGDEGALAEVEEVRHHAEALLATEPHDPSRFQPLMTEITVLLGDLASLGARLDEERYAAEREAARVHAVTMGLNRELGVTFAKAAAEVAALPSVEKVHEFKAQFRYLDRTIAALKARHYALMNLNRGMQSAMYEGGRRG
ncbi:hypothetical protein [Microbacterium caowuchunii]|uniref:Flagellar protein FlgN n=1 Tax=Microbacterium caowuchunii TaxID=2614638 RepID=A0A5N0TGY2_9MICO|nr:hypothetical protein [Microbacterium caowuchunii]KAA9133734.1 hypothetical protein F6B40_08250 [Microbacterium caowuchunii]